MNTKARHTLRRRKVRPRDVEKTYPRPQFVAKLRRLAQAVARDEAFTIRVAGEILRVPAGAFVNVEHERAGGINEIEFQVRWKTVRRRKG